MDCIRHENLDMKKIYENRSEKTYRRAIRRFNVMIELVAISDVEITVNFYQLRKNLT